MILPNKFTTTRKDSGVVITVERTGDGTWYNAKWIDVYGYELSYNYSEKDVQRWITDGQYTAPVALDNETGLPDAFNFNVPLSEYKYTYNATVYGERVLVSWTDIAGKFHSMYFITDTVKENLKVGSWAIVEKPEVVEAEVSKLTIDVINEFVKATGAYVTIGDGQFALGDGVGAVYTATTEEQLLTLMDTYKILNNFKSSNG